jgi:hypothetical protein
MSISPLSNRRDLGRTPRVIAALLAGAVAIALNTAVLAAAELVPLATAHGGLLRLLVILPGGAISPTGAVFQTGSMLQSASP